MVQASGGLRLAAKTHELLGITSRQSLLERDESMKASLSGLVHDAHATATQFLQDLVARLKS